MEELSQENSNYQKVKIEWIEESENLSYADAYDYYYVPCFFDGEKKVHEGIASKEIIRRIFDDYIRRIAKWKY